MDKCCVFFDQTVVLMYGGKLLATFQCRNKEQAQEVAKIYFAM